MSSTVHYLEMRAREKFQPANVPVGLGLTCVDDPGTNSRFYREVGASWDWIDRLVWTPRQWQAWVDRKELETWVAFFEGREAGYVEMETQEGGSVEIVYFGLLPAMIGKGLGGGMLTLALERAWKKQGTRRVWLHTCSGDHPHALANYEKRGFSVFKSETV